jgi:L-rhamnose 1-dehydrogenase
MTSHEQPAADRTFHPNTLSGRSAIVTGASRGIGAAIARALADAGAAVVINYHTPEKPEFGHDNRADAEALVDDIARAGGRAVTHQADVSAADQVERLVQRPVGEFGSLDILVCSAGVCPFSDFLELTEETWDRVHQVNLKGAFLCSQAAAKIMIEQGRGGRIIGMSSISALVGGGRQVHYTPTKAGMHSLMQSMAISLGPHGITCNSIMPGAIATDINADDWQNPETRARLGGRIPLGRMGEPADVAAPVVFLASDAARYVTGAGLLIDGGMFVNLQ